MEDLNSFLKARGYEAAIGLPLDGAFHRFDHGGSLSGWFKGFVLPSGGIAVSFGDWKTGEKHIWTSSTADLPPEEIAKREEELAAATAQEKTDREERQKSAAIKCALIWSNGIDRGVTPYLTRKGLKSLHGAKICPDYTDTLLVPARDIQGVLWGIQRILPQKLDNGLDKLFTKDMRIEGCFHSMGELSEKGTIYVCEGFATAASVFEAVGGEGIGVVSAFNAGNLSAVGAGLRTRYPHARIIFCADDDAWTTRGTPPQPWNPGVEKATAAAGQVSGELRIPVFKDRASKPTDFNDLHSLEGLEAVQQQLLNPPKEAPGAESKESKEEKAERLKAEGAEARKSFEATLANFNTAYAYRMLGGSKICYRWDGKRYVELGDQYIRQYALEMLRPRPLKKVREEFLDRVQISNLVEPEWFDKSTDRHINFANGVLSVDTGVLLPHSSDRGFRYVLDYPYQASATCPTFDAMMKRITCGDGDLERVLDEYMGYALSFDRYWYHKVLVLTGDGENGKSTWMDVLKFLAGQGNYSSLFMKDLGEPGNRQMLDGKLFNISPEVPKKGLFDTAMFKALSTGDEVQVRMIYKRPYTMKSRAKLIFACNELPDSTDTTQGFYRRLILVPFNAVFRRGDEGFDPHIQEKLQGELSGIFNRALAGYRRLVAQKGVTDARATHSLLTQYKMDNDSVTRWVGENIAPRSLEEEPQRFTPIREIYSDYVQEMEAGQLKPLSIVDFGRKLGKLIPDYEARARVIKHQGKAARALINAGYNREYPF